MTPAHKIGFVVKQQAAGRRRYVEHGGSVCSKCLTNPPVKGSGYCRGCKQIYEKARRARLKELSGNNKISKGEGDDQSDQKSNR